MKFFHNSTKQFARSIPFIWVILCLKSPVFGQEYGLTVFGTDLIAKDDVRDKFSDDLHHLKVLYDADFEKYKSERIILKNKLLSLGDFTYANIFLLKSYTGDYDFIIDYVETREASSWPQLPYT